MRGVLNSRAWAGQGEACYLAHWLGLRIYYVAKRSKDGFVRAIKEAVGPRHGRPVCLVWNSTHFDLIMLSEAHIRALQVD